MVKDAAPNEGARKEVGAVDVGSLEVGPPSASATPGSCRLKWPR